MAVAERQSKSHPGAHGEQRRGLKNNSTTITHSVCAGGGKEGPVEMCVCAEGTEVDGKEDKTLNLR